MNAKNPDVKTCDIYVRISQDRHGKEVGVENQERSCRDLAARLGLTIRKIYRDNDISATSGARRPGFEELLRSHPESIITWHQDRLLRLTKDLERVIALDVPIFMVQAGDVDLTTPTGRAVARTIAAWSQFETEQKAVRQRFANEQLAMKGHWLFSHRPYGYRRVEGKVTQVPEEAAVIREGYERTLAGESYWRIAKDWNDRGIKPLYADAWKMSRVQRLLENHHYAGIVSYKNELYPDIPPQWEPIITERMWSDFVELRVNRKSVHTWATSAKHLMSGLLICDVCDGRMFYRQQPAKRREIDADGNEYHPLEFYYSCESLHVQISLSVVDELVVKVVLGRLRDARIVKELTRATNLQPLLDEQDELTELRSSIALMLTERLIGERDARDRLADIKPKLDRVTARINQIRNGSPLMEAVGSHSLEDYWDSSSVLNKRRIITDLGLQVRVKKADMGKRPRDPETGKVPTAKEWTLRRLDVDWV